MQWNSVSEFLNMGGYAFYVWGSFGVTAVVMFGEMALIHRQRVATLAMLKQEFAQEGGTP
jgi:heme exporter protein D